MDDKKLSYFFLGLGLGVAVGILFAPKAGDETRGLIKGKANEGSDYLRRRGDEFRGTATEYVERGKTAVTLPGSSPRRALDALLFR